MSERKGIVNAKEFSDALKKVSGITMKSRTLRFLEEVRVDFTGDTCKLTASDYSAWLIAEIPASGDVFSFVFTSTKYASTVCRHFDGELSLCLTRENDNLKLNMACGGKSAEVKVTNTELSPVTPNVEALHSYQARADELLERINRVKYAARPTADDKALNGVRFEGHHVWCIDSSRMAVNDSETLYVSRRFIIPVYATKHLKVFGSSHVEIAVGENYAAFTGEGLTLLCRLLATADTFSVEKFLLQKSVDTYRIDRKEYLDAVRYLTDCGKGRKMRRVQFHEGTLYLMDKDAAFSAKVDTDGECGSDYAFDMNCMKDALAQFAQEDTIQVSSGNPSPIILRAGADTALLMPMSVKYIDRAA